MGDSSESLAAKIPNAFNQNLGELPADYVVTHGLLSISSARLELFLALAVNRIWQLGIWPANERNVPNKGSELIRWLKKSFEQSSQLSAFKEVAMQVLDEAAEINAARNDIVHSGILAHGEDGELYVARVRVDQKGQRFKLEEGSTWTRQDVGEITHRCLKCELAIGKLVSEMANIEIA